MNITQVIYSSRPFGFDDTTLNGILLEARKNNPRDNLTGALICRRDMFVQLLEGPEDKIASVLGLIREDDRHIEMTMRYSGTPEVRMFGAWAMLHDPETSWMWSMDAVANGALDKASGPEFLAVFEKLAAVHV